MEKLTNEECLKPTKVGGKINALIDEVEGLKKNDLMSRQYLVKEVDEFYKCCNKAFEELKKELLEPADKEVIYEGFVCDERQTERSFCKNNDGCIRKAEGVNCRPIRLREI